jgi:hypothetical protein
MDTTAPTPERGCRAQQDVLLWTGINQRLHRSERLVPDSAYDSTLYDVAMVGVRRVRVWRVESLAPTCPSGQVSIF